MIEDDDDLPVLTQILRTGDAPASHAPVAVEHAPEDFDIQPVGDTLMSDQLVIGNEPQHEPQHEPRHEIASYLAPSFELTPPHPEADAHAPTHPEVHAQARTVEHSDAFVLPQDHDGPHRAQTSGSSFNEPEWSTPMAEAPPEVPPEDPAVFAAPIRDAVLENLSARIDTELDARIAQAIHAEVETALAQLQGSLRAHLSEALKDVVGRAVDEEIARLAAARASDSA